MEIIQLNVGKSSIIRLPNLAMSGYLWSFQVDQKAVVLVTEDRNTTLPGNLKAGENLPKKFKVEALQTGMAKITFVQKRSWEENTAAISTLVFTVMVS